MKITKALRKFTITCDDKIVEEFDNVHATAKYLGCAYSTVHQYCKSGRTYNKLYKISYNKTYDIINKPVSSKLLSPEEGVLYYSNLYPNEEIRYNKEYDVFVSDQGNIFNRSKKRGKVPYNNNIHGYSSFRNTTVHKLVMKTFDKYVEGMEIDHINNIRDDNRLCNLQMLSHADNMKKRDDYYLGKQVRCIETNKTYANLKEAATDMGLSSACLCMHLKGKTKTFANKTWEYVKKEG